MCLFIRGKIKGFESRNISYYEVKKIKKNNVSLFNEVLNLFFLFTFTKYSRSHESYGR